jgi:hypothetical protein
MELEKFIKREIYQELQQDLERKEIAFLIGPRQSGKTTLIKLLQAELNKAGKKTLFLSLDFEHDRKHFLSQQALLRKIELEIGKDRGFVFIDEIQRKEDAGIFLKGIYDMDVPYKFIVSGSGSVDLKAKVKESLVGRKRIYELSTVTFKEFVNFKTGYRYENNLSEFFSVEELKADELLFEYLNFGGYPKVVLESELTEKLRVMDEIYQGYIERDISYLLNVEKPEAFGMLIKILAEQAGRLLNYSELSNTLGLSHVTLKNYLCYAEGTYILQRITPYFRNIRSEITKSPVIYFSDIGLRNYMLGIFGNLTRSEDLGFAFQNLIYLVLRDKLRFRNARVHYWRTKAGAEIDFVIEIGREVIPLEVKFTKLSKPAIPRAFEGFIKRYRPKRCLIISRSLKTRVKTDISEVVFLPLWELLNEDTNLLIG